METQSILQHAKVKTADTKKMALEIAAAALDKKAEGMLVLDVREITYCRLLYNLFGSNTRQVKATTEEMTTGFQEGVFPTWKASRLPLLMEYGDSARIRQRPVSITTSKDSGARPSGCPFRWPYFCSLSARPKRAS
jgi:hypothetical protein